MLDRVTIFALIGLAVFSWIWKRASSRTWYIDSDGDPVSARAIVGLAWMVCLLVLVMRLTGA